MQMNNKENNKTFFHYMPKGRRDTDHPRKR
jgi:hypothetical protein